MKKSILVALSLAFTLVAGTALGADWYIKFSGGANLPTMDSKMQFADGDAWNMEDYSGVGGVEGHMTIQSGKYEFSYVLQYYIGEKSDGSITIDGTSYDETDGELSFFNELIDVGYYVFDEPILGGVTGVVGIGKGTSRIAVNRKLAGTTQNEAALYAKVLHYHASFYYELTEMFFLKGTYRSLSINAIEQDSFSNSTFTVLAGLMF